ncbi:MAG TPA: porin family protein [Bacteroidia bacterium]|nr:porin family protein [Bacteroidia bacterium]
MRIRILILFTFTITLSASAQRAFRAGIVAGINGCQIHGDSYSGYDQIGFVAGMFVHNNPEEKWQGQMGIQYTRKGSRHVLHPDYGGYRDFEIRLNYIEVPLMVKYNTKKVFFELGATFGVLFKVREFDTQERTPQDFNRMEFGFVAGIGYNISPVLYIEFTSSNSILPIKNFSLPMYYPRFLPNLFNRGMYNNILGLTCGLRFGSGSNE